jgi:hypothetical protein
LLIRDRMGAKKVWGERGRTEHSMAGEGESVCARESVVGLDQCFKYQYRPKDRDSSNPTVFTKN